MQDEEISMEKQDRFIEMIEDVTALAKINHREVTKEFLEEYFKELELEESQLRLVYDYLAEHNISVKGYKEKVTKKSAKGNDYNKKNVEESEYLNLYLREVKAASSDNIQIEDMVRNMCAGDELAKEAVINYFLPKVINMSEQYIMQGLSQSDLIQEGNIGLLLGLSKLDGSEESNVIEDIVLNDIRDTMLLAIDEVSAVNKTNRNIIKKADLVKEKAEELAESMNDKMTMQEVADYMDIELSEIEDILRITGEEL